MFYSVRLSSDPASIVLAFRLDLFPTAFGVGALPVFFFGVGSCRQLFHLAAQMLHRNAQACVLPALSPNPTLPCFPDSCLISLHSRSDFSSALVSPC